MKKLGKEAVFIDGLRVTDKETVDIVQMVFAGKVNKSLVNLIPMKGGHAVGLSGIDGGIIEAKVKDEKLGFVGEITKTRTQPITDLLEKTISPSFLLSPATGWETPMTSTVIQPPLILPVR